MPCMVLLSAVLINTHKQIHILLRRIAVNRAVTSRLILKYNWTILVQARTYYHQLMDAVREQGSVWRLAGHKHRAQLPLNTDVHLDCPPPFSSSLKAPLFPCVSITCILEWVTSLLLSVAQFQKPVFVVLGCLPQWSFGNWLSSALPLPFVCLRVFFLIKIQEFLSH